MARTSKVSPVHWGVLLVGFPLAVISAIAWTFNAFHALRMPESHSSFDNAQVLFTRPNGMLYRLAGTTGPSGTIDSIQDEMNAAVSVGDGTSWIDPQGDVQEGTILEIKYEPFEVRGRRVDASAERPGYVIARIPDGEHVGVSDKLREGI